MAVRFTGHALDKISIFERYGIHYEKSEVEDIVRNPDSVVPSSKGRFIAQRVRDNEHVTRVIFERHGGDIVIVTFYPARRERYEG